MEEDYQLLLDKGIKLIKKGHSADAVVYLEKALTITDSSACYSWLGLAVAQSGGDMKRAEDLCKTAISKEFYWPHYYLNLAEIYLKLGKKRKAIKTLEAGLRIDNTDRAILDELNRLGVRQIPVISFLSRGNPVNKYLGVIFSRLKLMR